MEAKKDLGERVWALGKKSLIPDTLEIDHGRCDVAMPHPLMQRPDVERLKRHSNYFHYFHFCTVAVGRQEQAFNAATEGLSSLVSVDLNMPR